MKPIIKQFMQHEGAVVAPAAGFHFSREVNKRLEIKGVEFCEITLHAGLGNFREIDVEDLFKHKMDSEAMVLSPEAADLINRTKDNKHKIFAVGTTSMKAIESAVYTNGHRKRLMAGPINSFPPYEFEIADAMITNFHPSESSMLMMVCAFGGYEFVMKAYKEAIANKYRFLTYGDAMLII